MQLSRSNSGVKKVYGKITVDKVGPSLNEKKHTAQVRQLVTSVYPGTRAANSLDDALFPQEAFGGTNQSYDEARVAFLSVPVGTTVQEVEQRLNNFPNARLVKILSLQPILSEEQLRAMETGLSKNADGSPKTIEDYKRAQAVVNEHGEVMTYKGHTQYRAIIFNDGTHGPAADIDKREEDLADLVSVQMGAAQEVKAKF